MSQKIKKELSKLLETYDNSAEDLYWQIKQELQRGVTAFVRLPFSPKEVRDELEKVVQYILTYKVATSRASTLEELTTLFFEMGPCVIEGDRVQINILDIQQTLEAPSGKLEMSPQNSYGYTIGVKLKEEGALRTKLERDFPRESLAVELKKNLVGSVYQALRQLLYDDTSSNPQKDLEVVKEVAWKYGVVLNNHEDLDKILETEQFSDLGLRDLEELYVLQELLADEYFHIYESPEGLRETLREIINSRRGQRVNASIIID